MAQGSVPPAEGLYVVGRLVGGRVSEGRARPDGEGKYPDRYEVVLDVGMDRTRVQYVNERAARDAVAEANDGTDAVPGDVLTLPVGARAGAKGGAEAFIFYHGRTGAPADEVTW